MDDRELRYQLLDNINGPLEDAMYDVFGSKIYTISDTVMLEELEKVAVKEIIAKSVNYSTKFSEENPVKQQPSSQQPGRSSPAHSKSKKIAVKQPVNKPTTHSSPAHSSLAHSSPAHSSPAKFKPPAHAHALATLGLQREDQQVLAPEAQHILADNTSSTVADSTSTVAGSTSTVADSTSSARA
jgi:hypothetical protein